MTVRIVTDSNTMIPLALAAELGITVVPLIVSIGGDELAEDADLDLPEAYRRLRAGEQATTSAPAPGVFAATYDQLASQPIVSVHIGASYSGTFNAARVGAESSDAEVRLVDTANASFLAGMCVLAAAEAAVDGGGIDEVVAAAESVAAAVASVFTIAELDRAVAGGRLQITGDESGAPVLLMRGADITALGTVHSADEAADAMFDHVAAIDGPLRLGVGDADAGPVVDELTARLRAARPDDDVIRYAVGPTVAAHAGMGTFGIVYHSVARSARTSADRTAASSLRSRSRERPA